MRPQGHAAAPAKPTAGPSRIACAALALSLSACSHAHVANPRHKWMPMSHAVLSHITGGEISNDLTSMAVGAALVVLPLALDAITLPFHGLGHLFGPGKGPSKASPEPGY